MPRYKLLLEYDGEPFVGWQRQANGLSVQQALEEAILAASGEDVVVNGAGRTDAGVHATGQVAHIDLSKTWSSFRLSEALNALLVPKPIAVLSVEHVADDFDARFSATMRHYLYRIVKRRLDADKMREGAALLVGRHDFTTFRDSQCQAASPVKTLSRFEVERDGDEIVMRLAARSFLHRQVRSMVGSLEHVGSGKWSVGDLRDALEARDRARCGQVAPADGLYLERVEY